MSFYETNERDMSVTFEDLKGKSRTISACYDVCLACEGKGKTSAHVEHIGGGFTASEWDEMGEEFQDNYMSGVYDKPCPECKGNRVVLVPNLTGCDEEDREAFEETKLQLEEWESQQEMEMRSEMWASGERW